MTVFLQEIKDKKLEIQALLFVKPYWSSEFWTKLRLSLISYNKIVYMDAPMCLNALPFISFYFIFWQTMLYSSLFSSQLA